jgi:hypothetical protein
MSILMWPGARRRERTARRWDRIAENSARLVEIYLVMLSSLQHMPVPDRRVARIQDRYEECVLAEKNARAKAAQLRGVG